uniref:Axonemal dynein light chain domain containing 1 n=1 Tax=Sander lucioperca TaxID=283035 RepID=A0A8C9YG51_SANLU
MSTSMRASSAPSSSRPEPVLDTRVAELNFQVPAESMKTQPPPVNNHIIPDELLVSLTSTVCSRSTLGHTAHHRHCKGCGIRRPDAVWHHQLGRKKYKFFLEQPTSLTGAGRDISFLCDAVVTQRKTTPLPPLTERSGIGDTQNLSVSESLIPEEYHIVKNKGLRSLDAFTVQLQDDEQKLRVFPSLRPSGRQEVVQLMRMMDDMLEKAGVDQQSEELTDLSQMEGLLEMVQVEQNIYNIVFHELIRQVSVGCAERGQLLAKLRQRYQSLLERIPSRLKALHTETVAQRALDRRLTEEIHHIKTSIQQLNMELSRIRDHDAFVSQQAERAHLQLAGALEQTHTNSDVVQGYHELYELQRGRLEAQLLQMTEERDCWSQLTFCLALKVISVKKLQLISRLHIIEQSWFKTAEHCSLYLTLKDTEDLNIIVELSDYWKEQLTAFMSQLKKTEHAQCEQISAIQQGIAKWLAFCTTQNKCPNPKYEKASLENIHADLKQWSNTLALLCDRYQGEKLLFCQQTLNELGRVQERWLNMSLELFRRHPFPDGEPREGQQALRALDRVLSDLLKQLDTQITGENGIHGEIMSLLGLMESRVSKLGAVIGRPEMMSISDWLKLEKALRNWQSLAEKAFQNVSSTQTENEKDKNKLDIYTDTEKVLNNVQQFITSLSNFTDGEKQRLSEEVSSIHMAQTRWMLDLLLLMVPDHSEDHNQEQEHHYITNISLQTLDEDAKMLAEKLNFFSTYISRKCHLMVYFFLKMRGGGGCRSVMGAPYIFLLFCPLPITPMLYIELNNLPICSVCQPELVVCPTTEEAQKAFSDLTTVGLLQQELQDSELRVQSTEQRALKAEEALQSALEKIQDLERQLQGRSSLEPKRKKKKTPPPSPPPVTTPAPPKKTTTEAKQTSSTKKSKKR